MKQRKRTKRRILSVLLTIVMVFSTITGIVPGGVMTAKAEGEIPICIENGINYDQDYPMPNGKLMKGGEEWTLVKNNYPDYLELGKGNYKLTGDIMIYNEIRVTGEVTLDLNGYGIFQGSDSYSVIRIMEGGKLTINDSNPATEHYIHLINRDNKYGAYKITLNGTEHEWDNDGNSVIKVKGGYIAGGNNGNGGGVCVDNNAILNLNGGNIVGNNASKGGGIYVGQGGSASIANGASVSYNSANRGAGIYVDASYQSKGRLTMNGGTITKNIVLGLQGNGGGVYLAGEFTMNGGTISYNDATRGGSGNGSGGGVDISDGDLINGKFTMTGGTINNNVANYGAGIGMNTDLNWEYNAENIPTLTISGGSITDNTVVSDTNKGGGIYQYGVIKLQGTPVISGNKWIQNDTEEPSNILISDFITITGELKKNDDHPPFGISKQYEAQGDFTRGWSEHNSGKSPWDYFESEMPKYYVDKTPKSDMPEASLQPLLEVKIVAEDAVHTLHKTDSGEETQYKKAGSADPIDKVIYTVDDDYYFPDDYTDGINYSDERDDTWTYTHYKTEFTVTRDSITQITVSGTPREDTTITLPAPTEKASQHAPVAPTAKTVAGSSITLDTVTGCQYSKDGTNWQDSPIFTGLSTGTEYTFYQRLKGDDTHKNSPASDGAKISTPAHTHEWSYAADGETITATCKDSDGQHGTPNTATLTLTKPALTTYGGEGSEVVTITGSIDGVTNPSIVYKKGTETLEAAPTDAGTYTASITLGTATASLEYTIAKATAPTLTDDQKPTAKTGLKYDETSGESGQKLVNAPTATAPSGYAVKYSLDGENWSEEIPTGKDAGDYTVKVKYEGDNNHEDFNGTDIEVTIAKADQNKPDAAPTATVENIGSNSITLNTVEGCEYGIKSGESDEIKWQESPTFTGLTKSTEYTFFQRLAEDTNHNASLPSDGTTIKTSDHEHDWSFVADGATITATCEAEGHVGENTATLTINVPELTAFGGEGSPEVTITGNIDGVTPSIVYKKGDDTLDAAPTDAGDYTVEVTVGEGDKAVTAKESYTIAQAETTVSNLPSASAITYGQKLSDSKLTGGDETGTFTWKAPETVPVVADSDKTEYEAIFTPKDTNYKAATCKVKVTVNKAAGKTPSADAVKTANASSVSASDGKLNFDGKNTYQYSADDGVTWTDVKDATSVSVKAGTYKIRIAGNENNEPGEPITVKVSVDTPVSGVSVKADTVKLEKAGATSQIEAKVTPENATNKKLTYSSSDAKVATVDGNGKITAVANGSATITVKSADGNKTATVKVTVAIPETTKPIPQSVSVVTPEEEEKATLAMNEGLKISQTKSKINISWGKVDTAAGYDVYVQYCGSNFKKEPTAGTNKTDVTKVTVKKINGKKLNLKKNYKIYIEAYKLVDGKKVSLAKTITGHIVGRKNTAYTNVKMIKLAKSKYTVTAGKTAKIKAKTVLVDKRKKQLSNAHATQFRYASSDNKIATVSKKGKIKGIAKGQCSVYVYARNGYARKITVTVK